MTIDSRDLDILLLSKSSVTLYWKREGFEETLQWFEAKDYSIARFDCAAWTTLEQFHDALAARLDFPEYYGKTLDALNDVLGDLEDPLLGGLVIALDHFDAFVSGFPREAQLFLNFLAIHSRRELVFGGKLLALVQSDDPKLQLDPVGATPVAWNQAEVTESSRARPSTTENV